jgi:hypothetical protein
MKYVYVCVCVCIEENAKKLRSCKNKHLKVF